MNTLEILENPGDCWRSPLPVLSSTRHYQGFGLCDKASHHGMSLTETRLEVVREVRIVLVL
eukprot:1381745-Amorphochlora_amoeboformis.AAC.1